MSQIKFSPVDLTRAIKELYFWQYGSNPTNFTAVLYALISKADMMNLFRLGVAFPAEVEAFRLWQNAQDADAFFKEWLKKEE